MTRGRGRAHVRGCYSEPVGKPTLAPQDFEDLHRIDHRHGPRLLLFAALYLVAAGAAWQAAGSLPFIALVPLYLTAAAALHGISLFTHEGVHGTLSSRPLVNRLLASVCAWPVLQTFAAYQVLHLKHHKFLGAEGDPDHYPNYTRWTWMVFLMNWGRLIVGYPAYITAIPVLGFRQGSWTDRLWIAGEVMVVAGLVGVAATAPLPPGLLWHGWVVPMLCINTMVNIRGMSQHTLLEHHADPVLGTRTILTVPLVRFFMCNENYHLEHHLYPGVPWYNLPRLHELLGPQLAEQGAHVIPTYRAFVAEFIEGSVARSPLGHDA